MNICIELSTKKNTNIFERVLSIQKSEQEQNLIITQPQIKNMNSRSHRITEVVAEEEEMVNLTQNFENLVNYSKISNNKLSDHNTNGKQLLQMQ